MERLCFTFETRPGTAAEYKRRHDEIWPELVADIEAAGLSDYSLFRRGDSVIGYVKCDPDVATCFGKLGSSQANAALGGVVRRRHRLAHRRERPALSPRRGLAPRLMVPR